MREHPGKVSAAEPREVGEGLHVERLMEMCANVAEHATNLAARRPGSAVAAKHIVIERHGRLS